MVNVSVLHIQVLHDSSLSQVENSVWPRPNLVLSYSFHLDGRESVASSSLLGVLDLIYFLRSFDEFIVRTDGDLITVYRSTSHHAGIDEYSFWFFRRLTTFNNLKHPA